MSIKPRPQIQVIRFHYLIASPSLRSIIVQHLSSFPLQVLATIRGVYQNANQRYARMLKLTDLNQPSIKKNAAHYILACSKDHRQAYAFVIRVAPRVYVINHSQISEPPRLHILFLGPALRQSSLILLDLVIRNGVVLYLREQHPSREGPHSIPAPPRINTRPFKTANTLVTHMRTHSPSCCFPTLDLEMRSRAFIPPLPPLRLRSSRRSRALGKF